ncbi:BON domain-containing protein [Orrella sp. JC864]|uniref:BON domain-containing protein n=1 Tax=Orrella sp. JC864 TaxID=3120298 RepID=UPI0012BB4AAF
MSARKYFAALALGAAGTLAAPAVLAAGNEADKQQSAGEYVDDAVVTTKIRAAIVAEDNLSNFDIGVETIDGVTTLTGTVETDAQKEAAERVAKEVEGVRRVNNDLQVKG